MPDGTHGNVIPTMSSSTLATENLCALGEAAGLQHAHKDRQTSNGFPVLGMRLEGFMPTPPHKRVKKSLIWQNGVGQAITNIKTGKKFWLCRHCYDNPVPQPLVLVETDSTTPAVRHLQSRHNYYEKGKRHETSVQKCKCDSEDIRDSLKRLQEERERENVRC